jgi:hypothetical protein
MLLTNQKQDAIAMRMAMSVTRLLWRDTRLRKLTIRPLLSITITFGHDQAVTIIRHNVNSDGRVVE